MMLAANAWLPPAADLRLFSPELAVVATLAALLIVPILTGRRAPVAALLTMGGALVALLATSWSAGDVVAAGVGALTPDGTVPLVLADRFSLFFRMFVLTFVVMIAWLWLIGAGAAANLERVDAPRGIGATEFFVLLLTSALGMLLMVGTLNLLVIIVAMETASLPSYAIVASNKRSRSGAEAGLKYAMFGAASAAIMVYGASLLYGQFGTLDLGLIARQAAAAKSVPLLMSVGLVTFGAGLLFKIAAVPMHYWCPDVFEGAPIEVTTWLSVASKAAGLGLLVRIVDAFAAPSYGGGAVVAMLTVAIGFVAAVTCTVGNLAALRQDSVKRILAYSSIAHAGYMMMVAAIAAPRVGSGPSAAFAALVAYLLVYVVMNLGAFGATALVAWQAGTDHISAFTGLGRRAPWVALPLAICLFSLVGLPPLGGFTAKWYLLLALGKSAAVQPWLWALVVVAVLNTAISLYYYVRVIRQMYLVEDSQAATLRPPLGGVVMVNACALLLLLIGTLWFSPLGSRAGLLAQALFEPGAAATAAHAVGLP